MEPPQPLLSICIPSYNRSGLLMTLLNELDTPGFLPFGFEVIVSDNASPDEGYQAIAALAPQHYHLIYQRNPENIGVFPNLIGTMRRASGVFCTYLADDDRLSAADLIRIVNDMVANPAIVACLGHPQDFDLVENRGNPPPAHIDPRVFATAQAGELVRLLCNTVLLPEVFVFRTDAVVQCLFPSKVFFWSFPLIERLSRLGSILVTPLPYYRRVVRHPGDDGPRATAGRNLTFQQWASMEQGYRMLANRFLHGVPPDTSIPSLSQPGWIIMRQAFLSALHNQKLDQAVDIALAMPSFEGTINAQEAGGLALLGGLTAMLGVIQTWPEIRGLQLYGFADGLADPVANLLASLAAARGLGVDCISSTDPVAGDRVLLTRQAQERMQFLRQGCLPGQAFSLDTISKIFSFA